MSLERFRVTRWIRVGLVASIILFGLISFHRDIPAAHVLSKYTTPSSKFIPLDGMNVHYRDQGAGSAILLIHGSNSSLQTWEGWEEVLKRQFRVISVDLPGHGLTGPNPSGIYDSLSLERFVDNFSNAIGLQHFSIVGNSLGGLIAWNYVIRHPGKVEKLILIDALGYPDQLPPFQLRMWGFPVIGQALTVFTPRFVYNKTLEQIYGHPERVTPALTDRYFDLLLRQGNREATRLRFSQDLNFDNLPKLKSIAVPTLVMWGARDPWFSPEFAARFVQDIPNAILKLYPDLGHVPMEEAPEKTSMDAASFLSR